MPKNGTPVVLVVDDDHNLADLYTTWLADSYTVKTAYGGEDALNQLDSTIDIVLLDRRMPDLPGEHVLQVIRQRELDCQVALVTSVQMDYTDLPLDFDDYLQKPVTKPALHTLVESLSIRMEYSDKLQEYFALVSKRVALQSENEATELVDNSQVRRLDARIGALQEEIDGLLAEFSAEDYHALLATLNGDDGTDTAFTGLG